MITITLIPILKDNYAYLLESENGQRAILDPGDAAPIIAFLEARGITALDYIINTHHHWDHTDGNAAMLARYDGAQLVGPAAEEDKIGALDIKLKDGDLFTFGGEAIQVIETPGHTMGHICFYLPDTKALFAGDTIFSMGTGGLMEGTYEDMWTSLQKLMTLPDETAMYCGHEYTRAGAEFCLRVEPDNEDLHARIEEVIRLRARNKPTIPSSMGLEKKTNAYLRAGSLEKFTEIKDLSNKS